MSVCPSCGQNNPENANFCPHCGQALAARAPDPEPTAAPAEAGPSTAQLWETFIGPSKSVQFSLKTGWMWRPAYRYYQEKFAKIETPQGLRVSLSWNWPAALFDSFLWFLYRKMYMFALLYAVMPAIAIVMTGDMMVGLVSRTLAGASANYLYYWHMRDKLQRIMTLPGLDQEARANMVREEGGVQPYVLWLGAALHLFMLGLVIATISQGPPEFMPGDDQSPLPTSKFF